MTNAELMAFRREGGQAEPAQATAWLREDADRGMAAAREHVDSADAH